MSGEFRQALTERRDLIESRTEALLDAALAEGDGWTKSLGSPPKDAKVAATWRRHARTVAAYRDRYGINDSTPLGAPAEDDLQMIDQARAAAALRAITQASQVPERERRPARQAARGLGF